MEMSGQLDTPVALYPEE